MTSGRKTGAERRGWIGRGLAMALIALTALPAAAFDLPQLMKRLSARTSGEATFSEQRFVQGLDQPLVATGTLSYRAPDRFERRTTAPRAESLVVQGNTLTLSRGGRSRTLTLDASPEAMAAVEAVRGTLAGDVQALQRYFRITLTGKPERWTLALQPLDAQLAGALRGVQILGMGDDVRVVETELRDGDRTVMTIDPIRPGARAASAP